MSTPERRPDAPAHPGPDDEVKVLVALNRRSVTEEVRDGLRKAGLVIVGEVERPDQAGAKLTGRIRRGDLRRLRESPHVREVEESTSVTPL